jgi:hypothetical protein
MRSLIPRGGFEEGLDSRIIVAISFAAHGHLEAILALDLLMGTSIFDCFRDHGAAGTA